MFIAAPFAMVKSWKQPVSIDREWIKKMPLLYTMEYYSALKKNKIVPFAPT